MTVDVRWRGAGLDRLVDEDHARLVASVAAWLRALGWLVEVEVSYSVFGERGSYDLIAFHPGRAMLLAIEVKTDIPSAEATLRKLDEKARLASKVARERFGWSARSVSRLLVVPGTRTLHRRIDRHRTLFDHALPLRSVVVRCWLKAPTDAMAGIWFASFSDGPRAVPGRSTPERGRVPKSRHANDGVAG